jgi:hypothetical protein
MITAQEFRALVKDRRQARENPNLGEGRWEDIRRARLSDVLIPIEGRFPGKTHEERLQLVLDLEERMAADPGTWTCQIISP